MKRITQIKFTQKSSHGLIVMSFVPKENTESPCSKQINVCIRYLNSGS